MAAPLVGIIANPISARDIHRVVASANSVQVADRAISIATSEPKGPVYLSLPREVLAEDMPPAPATPRARRVAALPARPRLARARFAAHRVAANTASAIEIHHMLS